MGARGGEGSWNESPNGWCFSYVLLLLMVFNTSSYLERPRSLTWKVRFRDEHKKTGDHSNCYIRLLLGMCEVYNE